MYIAGIETNATIPDSRIAANAAAVWADVSHVMKPAEIVASGKIASVAPRLVAMVISASDTLI